MKIDFKKNFISFALLVSAKFMTAKQSMVRKVVRSEVKAFVEGIPDLDRLVSETGLTTDQVADYIVGIIYGEIIPVKQRFRANQLIEFIRSAMNRN